MWGWGEWPLGNKMNKIKEDRRKLHLNGVKGLELRLFGRDEGPVKNRIRVSVPQTKGDF